MTITEVRATGSDESLGVPSRVGSRARRRRWIAGALLVLVVAVAVAVMAGNEVQANSRFDQAHRSLDAVQARTVGVDARLIAARADLAAVDGQVTTDSAVLATDTSNLDSALVALAQSRESVATQSTSIGSLQTCLGGVEKALNALSIRDQKHAVAALQAVASACTLGGGHPVRSRRLLGWVVTLVVLAVVATAFTTDVQAHARLRSEDMRAAGRPFRPPRQPVPTWRSPTSPTS